VRILVVNAGSSSLKLRVLGPDDAVEAARDFPAPAGRLDEGAVEEALGSFGPLGAVGHRIVHGGTRFQAPVRIDDRVVAGLEALVDLAPLHLPKSLAALRLVDRLLPDVAAVACFDTAFHAGLPPAAATYALPREWRERWDLRRFGFHGLSHAYASRRAAELADRQPGDGFRVVTCHLGAGASLAAVLDGRSIDTTMGFTPLEGLVMATRAGSVDPGLVLWLEEHVRMPPAELAATLENRAGLLGLAGTADMVAVLAGAEAGLPDHRLALDVYLHRLRASIAAMTAALGGLDALVFTGGVGERSPAIRAGAAAGLAYLGVALDPATNAATDAAGAVAADDREIGAPGAAVRSFVVASREDLEIARQVRSVLAG